jgi:hypothetical protein
MRKARQGEEVEESEGKTNFPRRSRLLMKNINFSKASEAARIESRGDM